MKVKKRKPLLTAKAVTTPTNPPEKGRKTGRRPDGTFLPGHPWQVQPGQVGEAHPATGRRCRSLSAAFRNRLGEICMLDPARRTWAEVIATNIVNIAALGKGMSSVAASKELREATEGSTQAMAINGDWRKLVADLGGNAEEIISTFMEQISDALPRPS